VEWYRPGRGELDSAEVAEAVAKLVFEGLRKEG